MGTHVLLNLLNKFRENEKKENKQCLLDTPRRVPVIKDSYQNTKCQ